MTSFLSRHSVHPNPPSVCGSIYPTPPPSPDLDPPLFESESSQKTYALPIPVLLNTHHQLPHPSTFRLTTPGGILSVLSGSRVLSTEQSILDRMPYTAATAVIGSRDVTDEDQIERLVGGARIKATGLHWAVRDKPSEYLSSIFVQPPTPERAEPEAESSTPRASPNASPRGSPFGSPRLTSKPIAPVSLQVLPEVRSPPRRLAETADSLQITRRGRRPRLFGFTELPESSGSSTQNSPERHVQKIEDDYTPIPTSPLVHSNPLPRRQALRTRSESALGITTLPRRRENGLKLNLEGVLSPPVESAAVPSPFPASLIRKKSGEILKPALKYGGPLLANGTPLVTPQAAIERERARFESKSCPSTPSCPKYVHFDAQLEHVKLFLHDQKPHAVSRDGSPTFEYTTSEGEEFPFPTTDEESESKVLQIRLPNFPISHPPDAELFLESLFLDDDRKSLRGIVQCKNLSFQKWVAIRFTLDWWQTTSEVTATHKDSVKGGGYDRFTFVVKLGDVLTKIEEKTLFLCIRYNTDGREIWDSNGGQNYQVMFEKVVKPATRAQPARSTQTIQPGMGKAIGGRTSQWSVTGGGNDKDRLADLRSKLDRLVADDLDRNTLTLSPNAASRYGQLSPSKRIGTSPQGSPRKGFSSFEQSNDLPAAGQLSARYDFGTALKTTTRQRSANSPNVERTELPDVQTGLLQFPRGRTHAASEFYSPRLAEPALPPSDYFFFPPVTGSPIPDVHVQGPSPPAVEEAPTPKRPSMLSRHTSPAVVSNALPRFDSANDSPPQLERSGSVTESTPSDSPKSPPDVSLPKWSPPDEKKDITQASYSSFIEQFCWGGAAPSGRMEPRRTHSASSLDQYFSQAMSSPGSITPKASHHHTNSYSHESQYSTPSSVYYTPYSSASTPRRDVDRVDLAETVRSLSSSLASTPLEKSPARRVSGLPGHLSPPVVC